MSVRASYPRSLAWPPLLYLIVLFVIPTGLVAGYSFLERDFYGQVFARFSWDAWRQAVDRTTLMLLARSIGLAATATLLCALLGYPCALAAARLSVGRRQSVLMILSFPLATSLLLRIYGWMNLLPAAWQGNLFAVVGVMTINSLPFMVLPLLRACERIDAALPDAALDLGATPWRTFLHVTWPLTRPGLLAGCALVFIPSAGDYLVPHFIGGKIEVLGTEIVREFMERRNWPYAAACAVWLLTLIAVPAVCLALANRAERGKVGP